MTFKDVIEAWPSRKDCAAEVGVTLAMVNKWHELDSIRGVYFMHIVEASKSRHGADAVTSDDLCRLAARHASLKSSSGRESAA
ncbi:hypothetical protein [Celeribacter ethanolicus]|nr:hypothetical protein [Celeribacter ethanolicus]